MSRSAKSVSRSASNSRRPALTIRYLVVEGEPNWEQNETPESPYDFPRDLDLSYSQLIAEFPTVEEAIAESANINRTMMRCNVMDRSWSCVVVRANLNTPKKAAKGGAR
jgi:hypothetical protein